MQSCPWAGLGWIIYKHAVLTPKVQLSTNLEPRAWVTWLSWDLAVPWQQIQGGGGA